MSIFIETKKIINDLEVKISDAGNKFAVLTTLIKNIPIDDIKDGLAEIELNSNYTSRYIEGHYHIDHLHGHCHQFNKEEEDLPTVLNDNTYKKPPNSCRKDNVNKNLLYSYPNYPITALFTLFKEFTNWEDYDMNFKIFGKDFIFNASDKQVPFELVRIQSDLNIRSKEILTWSDYLDSCPDYCPWKK